MTSKNVDKPLYDVNEKVLCSCEDGLYYEAKIVRVGRAEDGGLYYKVHYQGWSKTYDEIIHENLVPSRFINLTPQTLKEALDAQNARRELDKVDKEKKGKRRSKKSSSFTRKEIEDEKFNDEEGGTTRKQSITSSSCSEELNGFVPVSSQIKTSAKLGVASGSGVQRLEANSNVSHDDFLDESSPSAWLDESLLIILEKDHQFVEGDHKLPRLPAKYTATKIVNEYAKFVRQVNKTNKHNFSGEKATRWKLFMKAFDECMQAFLDLFDIVIQDRFLNSVEKLRHEELINNGIVNTFNISDIFEEAKGGSRPSQYYGFIYVVRLLADFKDILKRWSAPGVTTQVFETFVKGFLRWLGRSAEKYLNFETDYEAASDELLRVLQGLS